MSQGTGNVVPAGTGPAQAGAGPVQAAPAAVGHAQGAAGGIVDLPLPGTKAAPKKFKGKYTEVLTFLHFYERLCQKHHVVSDKDRVESITQYCSQSVKKFMEGLQSYQIPNWNNFVRDIKKFYEADKDDRRFVTRDLEKLAKHSKLKSVKTMKAWNKYMRDFIRIAGWLRQHSRLAEYDYRYYFWIGIPEKLRAKLEARLVAQLPNHDMSEPFPTDDVIKVAEGLLHRRRFDRDRLLSEPETEDSDSATTTSSDSSDSDSDFDSTDDEPVKKRNKKKTSKRSKESAKDLSTRSKSKTSQKAKKTVKFQKPEVVMNSDSESDVPSPRMSQRPPTPVKESVSKDDIELEKLIKDMEKMALDDPEYAVTYFRACNRNPLVKSVVAAPVDRRKVASQPSAQSQPSMTRTRNYDRETPPHMAGAPQSFQSRPPESRACFGCGNMGHAMRWCDELNNYFSNGTITRNDDGKITFANGKPIFRNGNEFWVPAIKRILAAQANLVTTPISNFITATSDNRDTPQIRSKTTTHYVQYYEGSSEEDDSFESALDSDAEVFNATRTEKEITKTRRDKFDGVWLPTSRELAERRRKQNLPPAAPRAGPLRGARKEPEIPKTAIPTPALDPLPFAEPKPIFDPNDDDAFMEDATQPATKPSKGKIRSGPLKEKTNVQDNGKTDAETMPRRQPRKSELQNHVNPKQVLDRVLNVPVTLAI